MFAIEQVEIRTLDSVLPPLLNGRKAPYLKIDTQGFEREVLLGARESLASIALLQLELSLVPLYEAAPADAGDVPARLTTRLSADQRRAWLRR
jgi:hypothetical protein